MESEVSNPVTQDQRRASRQLLALAIAPLVPCYLVTLSLFIWNSWGNFSFAFVSVLIAVCAFGYFAYLLIGLPLLLFFKVLGWQKWYHFILAGVISSFAFLFALQVRTGLLFEMGTDYWKSALWLCGFSALGGLVVWFIGFRKVF